MSPFYLQSFCRAGGKLTTRLLQISSFISKWEPYSSLISNWAPIGR
ncbi:unnamed protein product [Linum tenue]|uniref:Uncharacterized protein n=1 Tax=Linum tenue TaxID=586396 RepID=A0AAV0M344_9ROSI|nr:unnamed protein product [Linum tenue]